MTISEYSPTTRIAVGQRRLSILVLASALSFAAFVAMNNAYAHDDSQSEAVMPMKDMHDDDHGTAMMHDEHDDARGSDAMHDEHDADHGPGMMHHAHDKWVDPPPEYADKRNSNWEDRDAMLRGHEIYETQCVVCHGLDGQGTGPISGNLTHRPADLTNHFHRGPGLGDGYLFWRVSEGGTAEPFKSQGSAMPAFKKTLTEQQRWDVLTFVHHLFHRGYIGDHDPDDKTGSSHDH